MSKTFEDYKLKLWNNIDDIYKQKSGNSIKDKFKNLEEVLGSNVLDDKELRIAIASSIKDKDNRFRYKGYSDVDGIKIIVTDKLSSYLIDFDNNISICTINFNKDNIDIKYHDGFKDSEMFEEFKEYILKELKKYKDYLNEYIKK